MLLTFYLIMHEVPSSRVRVANRDYNVAEYALPPQDIIDQLFSPDENDEFHDTELNRQALLAYLQGYQEKKNQGLIENMDPQAYYKKYFPIGVRWIKGQFNEDEYYNC